MSNDLEIPEFVHSIPADADPATRLHMQAQAVINAVFHTFGDPDAKAGSLTLSSAELERVLAAALAMLISTDDSLKTRQDIRFAVDRHARNMRNVIEAMRQTGDGTPGQLLDALNLERSRVN